MIEAMIQISYLFAAFMFIVALRALGRPESARRGMQMAAVGMLVAVVATLLQQRIISYEWIVVAALVGGLAGYPMGGRSLRHSSRGGPNARRQECTPGRGGRALREAR